MKLFKQHIIRIIVLILFFSATEDIFSQSNPHNKKIPPQKYIYATGIRGGFGVLIPHRESMIHLVTGHVVSTEFYLERCAKNKNWNHHYRFPTSGISFYYGYLSSKQTLGNAFALDFYSNMHLVKSNGFLFDMRLATGLGYLSKTFDPQENNHNVAIGSHLNISIGVSFDLKFQLRNQWQLATGLSLKHFSNGSFSTPNLGINIPVWMVGLKKNLSSSLEYTKFDSTRINILKNNYSKNKKIFAMIGLGAKEIYPAGGNRFGIYSLQLGYIYAGNYKSAFSGGVDIIHNVALYKHAYYNDTLTDWKPSKFTQAGIHVGYIQQYDNFELFIQCGMYILNNYNKDGAFYQRLGGRYYFKNNITAHFALKTHFAKADYFEIGLGYYLRKNKIKKESVNE